MGVRILSCVFGTSSVIDFGASWAGLASALGDTMSSTGLITDIWGASIMSVMLIGTSMIQFWELSVHWGWLECLDTLSDADVEPVLSVVLAGC